MTAKCPPNGLWICSLGQSMPIRWGGAPQPKFRYVRLPARTLGVPFLYVQTLSSPLFHPRTYSLPSGTKNNFDSSTTAWFAKERSAGDKIMRLLVHFLSFGLQKLRWNKIQKRFVGKKRKKFTHVPHIQTWSVKVPMLGLDSTDDKLPKAMTSYLSLESCAKPVQMFQKISLMVFLLEQFGRSSGKCLEEMAGTSITTDL